MIVTCADSRVPAEAIFQTELGDLFVIRVAGCSVDSSVIVTFAGILATNLLKGIVFGALASIAFSLSSRLGRGQDAISH